MPRPGARKLEEFDPNKSDSDDGDFDANALSSPRPRRAAGNKRKNPSSRSQRTPQKKRTRRGSDTSDIVDDDEDIEEEAFTASSEDEAPVERSAKTGRAVRAATKKVVGYEESDADEEQFVEETSDNESDRDELNVSPNKTRIGITRGNFKLSLLKPSKIVRLGFTNWEGLSSSGQAVTGRQKREDAQEQRAQAEFKMTRTRSNRSRTASRPPQAAVGPPRRKSSRLSREPEALQALSSSGRHAIPASSPSGDDEELPSRRTVGSKGPLAASGAQPSRKMPSVVMEASQEGTQHEVEDGGQEAAEPMLHDVVDSVEMEVEEAEPEGEGAEPETILETDIPVAAEDAAAEAPAIEEPEQEDSDASEGPVTRRNLRARPKPAAAARSPAKRKRNDDESSEFNPDEVNPEDEHMSVDEADDGRRKSKRLRENSSSQSNNGRQARGGRSRNRGAGRSRQQSTDGEDSDEIDDDELAEEVDDLRKKDRAERRTRQTQARLRTDGIAYDDTRRRRTTKQVDYSIMPLADVYAMDEQQAAVTDGEPSQGGKRRKKGKKKNVLLHSIGGIFGNWDKGMGLLTDERDEIALEGHKPLESDDEDEEEDNTLALKTPATHDAAGGPAEFGKLNKEKKAAGADADPLGVDENVKFDAVGGLDDHINALKEMVLHPLMYPEVIGKFGVQPPRGVLFHGPPGTGKTLLARALSNSIESEGKKVTFFMRKGADALSKWVGEAERQLRLLFEEAQKCQPSIIFFDEIDGLAPTRSSKTEQIHASIVATLLALMDGMDNRGQVVVIGATNRPDNVDPALRRPGRFDREFYFPLPDKKARMSIIDINTKGWEPALPPRLKDDLARLTVGYGGADLRALCTEAALNAIQGTYPQIYKSNKKLLVDVSKIKVLAKDFMISVNKITPSSARTQTGKVEPLPKSIEPLLRQPLEQISKLIEEILPRRKIGTALEEAEFDDRDDPNGFERDMLQRDIDRAKIFRPRLLVRGLRGMGQQELGSALLHKLEGLFVQSFDMATLMEDSSRSTEAAVAQLFKEVKRQKPSIIFIPDVDVWYATVGDSVLKIFLQQLRSIPANDPVLLLGMMSADTIAEKPDPGMLRDLFGFSKRSDYHLDRPHKEARYEFWTSLVTLMKKRPNEFPDPSNRKKRTLEILPEVQPTSIELRKEDKKKKRTQYREERNALNMLKMMIQPVFDQIKKKYGILRYAQIPLQQYKYLFDDVNDGVVTSDLSEEQRQQMQDRPFVLDRDKHGRGVLKEVATGKYYYNMDIEDIEERLANGYYRRWRDFLADIRTIMHDAMTVDANTCPDPEKQDERRRKTQELVNNVEVDLESFRREKPQLDQQLQQFYARVLEQVKEKKKAGLPLGPNQHPIGTTTNQAPIIGRAPQPAELKAMGPPITPLRHLHAHTNGTSTNSAPLTNGSTVPSRGDAEGDVTMNDVTPAQKTHSQRSALEKMAPGSHQDDYRNSGSTTTSGQYHNRTSGGGMQPHAHTQPNLHTASLHSAHTPTGFPIGYSSVPTVGYTAAVGGPATVGAAWPGSHVTGVGFVPAPGVAGAGSAGETRVEVRYNSQGEIMENSNGSESRHYPHWNSASDLEGLSQIPDTQPNSDNTQHSKSGSSTQPGMGMGNRGAAPLADIVNKPEAIIVEEDPPFELREDEIQQLHKALAEGTSGFSVEQLVQCMAELVGEVIRNRGAWDKHVVVEAVRRGFEATKMDIEEMQVMMEGSYEV